MLDAFAVGEVFSSPTAGSFLDAFKAAGGRKGVTCLYGNYAGDNMNVNMVMKKATLAGITTKTVVANGDVASAPADDKADIAVVGIGDMNENSYMVKLGFFTPEEISDASLNQGVISDIAGYDFLYPRKTCQYSNV